MLKEQILERLDEKNKNLLKESLNQSLYKSFIKFCIKELQIHKGSLLTNPPKFIFTRSKKRTETLGHNDLGKNEIVVFTKGRLTADIFRTLAHELVHSIQMQLGELTADSGADGSDQENEANSLAGVILRKFGRSNPEIYAEDTTSTITVYRKIVCPTVDYNELGIHSSKSLEYVQGYDPEKEAPEYTQKPGEKTYLLYIDVRPEQINKEATEQSNQSHPEEQEVVLLPNQKVGVKVFELIE